MSLNKNIKEYFKDYAQMLLRWNHIHNLSGSINQESVYENIFDSIYPLRFIKNFDYCMDIGSGAGFPALPLAMCRHESKFILVEPRNKRASFLQNVIVELGLRHVEVKKCLIENLKLSDGEKVDLITSRALMKSENLIQLTKKFLKKNGYYLFYKGSYLPMELDCNENECIHRENRIYFYRKDA
ncbi:16S rRNA (guanine(527)-N(7))-methyltransferase RsmG [Helicobacter sp. 11S03491-1]|nr:16S rRNA (guanine(527)-N(7))-methyltransferase RsmG [Helicobacter sp. 11S03491-1]